MKNLNSVIYLHFKLKGIESLPQTQISKYLRPDSVDRWYFKLTIFDLTVFIIVWNMSRTLGCKDLGIRISECVAKTQFLYIVLQLNISIRSLTLITKSCYSHAIQKFIMRILKGLRSASTWTIIYWRI